MKLFASISSIFTKKEEEQSPCVFTGNDLVLLAEFEYVLKSNPTVVRDLMGLCIDALEKSPAVAKDLGQALAAPGTESTWKTTTYAGGESAPTRPAAPGYRPFFVIALFFAILHLGILILGSGTFTPVTIAYLVGLLLALLALILG